MKRNPQRLRGIEARLGRAMNAWMATITPSDTPHLLPVWFVWMEKTFYFVVAQGSEQFENLRRNQNVAITLPDAEKVIIIEGEAHTCDRHKTAEMADHFYHKYEFDYTQDDEYKWYLVALEPTRVLAWGDGHDEDGVVVSL